MMASMFADALRDRYRLERELGRGGMATVYLARDLKHDRPVALKVLHPELAASLGPERFLREIKLTARLQHPHILPVFDSGESQGQLWYTMPYVEGESLRQRLRRGIQLSIPETVRIAREVAAALDYAHEHRIIHRDIKPENILLAGDKALVADFGLARALDAAGGEQLTETGIALGTPAYMSPEQASAGQVDAPSDIYALGCVVYEMLAGEPPFTGPTAQAIIAKRFGQPVPRLRAVRETVPESIDRAVEVALAKVPADRFETAGEFATAIAGSGLVRGASGPARTRLLRLAAALALGALGVIALWHWRPMPDEPTDPRRLAILPFDVSAAAPDLAWLGDGMIDLFSIRLREDTALKVIDPRTVLAAWYRTRARADTTFEANARLARRIGAGRVVEGSVVGSPARLVLSASIRPVSEHQPGPRVTVTGPGDSLPVLVDRLTAQLVGIDAGVDRQRLGSGMSSSLAAIRAFARGRAEYRRGHLEEAIRYLREATVLDSTFVLAALDLARLSGWLGGADGNEERARRLVWMGRDRLSPTDRELLKAWQRPWAGAPAMFANRRAEVTAYPNEPHSWYELGDTYFHWGILAGQDSALEQARSAFRRGWSIDSATSLDPSAGVRSPVFAEPLTHMVDLAQLAGDTADVLRLTALGLEADTAGGQAHYLQWHQALARGDSARRAFWANQTRPRDLPGRVYTFTQGTGIAVEDAARAIAEDMAQATGEYASFLRGLRAFLALDGGRPEEANRDLAVNSSRFALRERVLIALYWQGDTVGIADIARRMAKLPKVPAADLDERRQQYHDLCVGFQWRLSQGETEGAAEAVELLRTAHIPGDGDSVQLTRFARVCSALLRVLQVGSGALSGGQALADLDSLARTDVFEVCCGGPTGWDGNPGANLVLARAAEYQGDLPLALRAVRRRAGGFMMRPTFMSTFLREEGRLAAITGDTAGAIRAYQHYLALRPNPEQSLRPEVERVRGDLARLLGERP